MARTESNMMPIGTIAPSFDLPDTVSGNNISLDQIKSDKGTVVMFICNHCPYVVHVKDKMVDIANTYARKGIAFVAISSNDVENYPDDSPENMRRIAGEWGFNFPYLYDQSQAVAKAYDAACTPDFYVFDADLKAVYRGRMDSSTPGNNEPVTGRDLQNALNNLLEGEPIDDVQYPSMGCNIKWKH